MYLTRFQINTARRGARKLLASPQAMHAAVLASFADPAAHNRDGARTLWRVDNGPLAQSTLYIASPTKPDLTHLVEQAGWPTTDTWRTRPYDSFLNSLQPGQQWAFRLTANPTRNGRSPKHSDTRRFGHVTVDQQQDWLLRRAKDAGFEVTTDQPGERDLIVHSRITRQFKRSAGTITLRMATYDGRLEVTNAEALRTTLTAGIGHAKAYGCGLLTLAPAG
ncbi:MAG: type I-E CRISPR-associated protein Cas6/Cse3/CasE [Haloechinothrix sp.]